MRTFWSGFVLLVLTGVRTSILSIVTANLFLEASLLGVTMRECMSFSRLTGLDIMCLLPWATESGGRQNVC